MKTSTKLSMAIAAILFAGTLKAQTNLITNGGFEEVNSNGKPTGWYNGKDEEGNYIYDYLFIDTSDKKEGNQCCRVTGWNTIKQKITTATAGHKFDISFWYKCSDKLDESSDYLSLGFDGNFIGGNLPEDQDKLYQFIDIFPGEWQLLEIEGVTSPDTNTTNTFGFSAGGQNCTLWLDDVEIVDQNIAQGISNVKSELPIHVEGNILYVPSKAGETVSVYNTVGAQIITQAGNGETVKLTDLPQKQLLIVRSGSRTAKVIL